MELDGGHVRKTLWGGIEEYLNKVWSVLRACSDPQ